MEIGLIAVAGVKLQTRRFIDIGITLPQFINRGQVIAQLPSLALLTIAGVTPKGVGLHYLEVDDVDAFCEDPPLGFDLVALSTYTARAFETYRVADAYRARGTAVVIGGLHATVVPHEAAEHADAVVIGEGELTWPRVVENFLAGGKAALERFYKEERPGQFKLADSPMPRFDLLRSSTPASAEGKDPHATGEIHRSGGYNRITVQTSRGCPWDCEFCAASKLYGPRYRRKPIDRILTEIDEICSSWRRPFLEFADDNTFVHKSWSKQLLRELASRDIRYFTETDISVVDDDELVSLLYPSGCRQLLIGFETIWPDGLVGMDTANWKARQFGRYLDVIDKLQSAGVSVCGCFIVGLDTDTPAVFDELREFIDRSKLLEVQVTVLTPFPGTRLYDRLLDEGRLLYPGDWDRCTLFDVNFKPKHMSVERLEDELVSLWSDIWSKDALDERKRHYRRLLRQRSNTGPGLLDAENGRAVFPSVN